MIGILGGTFDPVHHGHLRCAVEVRERFGLGEVRLIPCGEPPHREAPAAGAAHRLAMLEAAIGGEPGLCTDGREVQRDGPSFTVDTLASLREDFPDRTLCLILGMDAFVGLPAWHRWRDLFELAHLIVIGRPGAVRDSAPAALREEAGRRAGSAPAALRDGATGRIVFQEIPPLDIAASRIRRLIATGQSARYLLPDAVLDHIHAARLYRNPSPSPAEAPT